jgi:5'-3' exonuclease
VLFGFLNTLLNLLELAPPPTHFAVVFDAPGKNFR